MSTLIDEPDGLLRVVMERDFYEFTEEDRSEFLRDLATITGLAQHQLRKVRFKPGCVLAEIRIPETALEALLDLYNVAKSGESQETLAELNAFLWKYKVANINGEFKIALQLRLQTKPIDAESGTCEILFLHGFTGDKTTFGNLPKFLAASFKCDARVFEYPTGWLRDSPSIYFLAQGFDTWFRNTVKSEKVAIISHSMGGLVARKFITMQANRSRPVDDYIAQLTFVASPHDGANLASIAKRILGLNSAQLHDLSPYSGFVAELKLAWQTWLTKNQKTAQNIRSIYSPADLIVDPANAMGFTGDGDTILGASHSNIVKPKDENDQIVLTIKRYLCEAGFKPVRSN